MKRLLLAFALLACWLAIPASAQQFRTSTVDPVGNCTTDVVYNTSNGKMWGCNATGTFTLVAGQVQYVTVAPSGTCTAQGISLLTPNGTLYTCQNGTWAPAGGGGSGTGCTGTNPCTFSVPIAAPSFTGTGSDTYLGLPSNTGHTFTGGDVVNNNGVLEFNTSLGTYYISLGSIAPTFSPPAGAYSSTQSVTISSISADATICYSTSTIAVITPGTCPGGSTTYSVPVSVSSTQTLYAVATKANYLTSTVSSAAYTVNAGISLISHAVTAGAGSTTSAINTTGANMLIANISSNAVGAPGTGAGGGTISDSKGNTWTALTGQSNINNNSRLFYVLSPVVGTGHTFTCVGAATFCSMEVASFSNVTSFDQQSGSQTAAGVTCTPGSITSTTNGNLYLTGLAYNNVTIGTPTIDNSFTNFDGVQTNPGTSYGSWIAYKVQATAGALNPVWTNGGSTVPVSCTLAIFKP